METHSASHFYFVFYIFAVIWYSDNWLIIINLLYSPTVDSFSDLRSIIRFPNYIPFSNFYNNYVLVLICFCCYGYIFYFSSLFAPLSVCSSLCLLLSLFALFTSLVVCCIPVTHLPVYLLARFSYLPVSLTPTII